MGRLNALEFTYEDQLECSIFNLKQMLNDATESVCEERQSVEVEMYITYLGYIDSVLMGIKDYIKEQKEINDYKEVTLKENEYKEILKKRSELVKIIKEDTDIFKYFNFAEQVINKVPSLLKFNVIYNEISARREDLSTGIDFIDTYNHGLSDYLFTRFENMDEIFYKYHNELKELRLNNDQSVTRPALTKKTEGLNESFYKHQLWIYAHNLKCILDDSTIAAYEERQFLEVEMYITHLGYIDSVLMGIKDYIKGKKGINGYKEVTLKENEYKEILKKRFELVKIIKEDTDIFKYFNFAEQVVNKVPSFLEFGIIYNEIFTGREDLSAGIDFINAYNKGLTKYSFTRFEDMNEIFNECYDELSEYYSNNKKLKNSAILTRRID